MSWQAARRSAHCTPWNNVILEVRSSSAGKKMLCEKDQVLRETQRAAACGVCTFGTAHVGVTRPLWPGRAAWFCWNASLGLGVLSSRFQRLLVIQSKPCLLCRGRGCGCRRRCAGENENTEIATEPRTTQHICRAPRIHAGFDKRSTCRCLNNDRITHLQTGCAVRRCRARHRPAARAPGPAAAPRWQAAPPRREQRTPPGARRS